MSKCLCGCGRELPIDGTSRKFYSKECRYLHRQSLSRVQVYVSPKWLKRHFRYDPDEGRLFITRIFRGCDAPREVLKNKVAIDSRVYMSKRICFILATGEHPEGRIKSVDGNPDNWRWTNLFDTSADKNPKGSTRREVIKFEGRSIVLTTDSSKPVQPNTFANKMRMEGRCKTCDHYLSRCLGSEMKLKCIYEKT